ncbi:hypothetical protein EC991_002988 [Linnemannia zychae]|nr:hypothetical protein EC991_002988 [Linnemannia zychae]
MASHLYNLRDTEGSHHYDLRDSTASATKDQMVHSNPQQHSAHGQASAAHVHGKHQDHAQKSHTDKTDQTAPVKLATGTEANLEHPVNPEHDATHPGH